MPDYFSAVFFQIYDEFRFLDETDAPVSPASSANPIMKPTELVEWVLFARKKVHNKNNYGNFCLQEPLSTNSLVDFDKPEGFNPLDEGSSKTLRIRSAVSVLIPAAFQCIAAVAGFWPLVKRNRSYYQSDVVGMCLALGIALIAATVCCFSIYATSRSLTNVTQ
uniref:Transmembrane protein n=1 Tax=Angiostrongylus cantonensis TaxID=6313 RepID=A0A0K0DQ30_ANGCA